MVRSPAVEEFPTSIRGALALKRSQPRESQPPEAKPRAYQGEGLTRHVVLCGYGSLRWQGAAQHCVVWMASRWPQQGRKQCAAWLDTHMPGPGIEGWSIHRVACASHECYSCMERIVGPKRTQPFSMNVPDGGCWPPGWLQHIELAHPLPALPAVSEMAKRRGEVAAPPTESR